MSIILTVFLVRDVIWNSGFIYSRDLILPSDLSLTFGDLTDTWDNIHSRHNLELNKIPLFALFSAVDEVIGSENTQEGTFRNSHLLYAICHFHIAAFGLQGKSKIKYQTDCNMCTALLIVLVQSLGSR